MTKQQLEKTGTTICSLGGLLVIFNLTIWKENQYSLWLSIVAVIIILVGLLMINKGKKIS